MVGDFVAWVVEGAVWLSVGLVVGWNVLPQPAFVKSAYDKVVAYAKAKLSK